MKPVDTPEERRQLVRALTRFARGLDVDGLLVLIQAAARLEREQGENNPPPDGGEPLRLAA